MIVDKTIKILAQYNLYSGGSYHRVKLWSEFVENVTLTEVVTEDQVKECDILYIHWNLNKVSIPQLSVWREKYGFKVIVDIDDVWMSSNKISNFKSQHLCLFADHVICSTDYLVEGIKEWNQNVTVIPNLIPFGHGQFTPRTHKSYPEHKKLRIGIGGSISHFEDYMSLKGTIKYLEKQKWFQDNCQFVIIGYYAKDPRWRKVAAMFKDPLVFGYKSPETYMSLYEQLDVMLLPLLDTPINRGRSNLKIWECICKNVTPIVSTVYNLGEDLFTLKEDWATNILGLLKTDSIEDPWIAIRKDYNVTCVKSRTDLFRELAHRTFTPPDKHNLFSITYADSQDVEYTEFRNKISTVEEKSYLFEYNPMMEIIDKNFLDNRKYTGVFSHKFPFKTGYYRKYVEQILDQEDVDVVIFCRQISNYFLWSEQQHSGLMHILTKICEKLGITGINKPIVTVYSNFFAAKSEVYKEYCKFLKSAIYLMEHDQEIKGLVSQNANYKSGLSPEDLKRYTGLDYYTFHTFVLERLISIWIDHKNLTCSIYE